MPRKKLPRPRVGRWPLSVFRVDEGMTLFVRTLSEGYGGLWTHYVQKRSRYCPGDRCSCQHSRLDRVWKGYAPVELWEEQAGYWSPIVLELTEALEIMVRGRWARGQVWQLSKAPDDVNRKNYPVEGKLMEELKEETLPHAFDYKPILMRFYHAADGIETSHANPMPLPLMVEPSKGAPPAALAKPAEAARQDPGPFAGRMRETFEKLGRMPEKNGHQ